MRVRVNREACQGNGRCVAVAPEIYTLDDLGYNVSGEFTITDEQGEAAFRGAAECPERAIHVHFD
ncbi:ferredoxin [Pseudonocardia sp. GCM10023141]|uniref:ferredoxin n=1 Tax=Pseudonocardia sp. GCM10023141 TaxID=3252653 RepID=UPI00360D44E4